MSVNYEKQTLDNPNPIARYAHRARFSRSKKIVLASLQEGSIMVDYGCGQGRFYTNLMMSLENRGRNARCMVMIHTWRLNSVVTRSSLMSTE